MWRKISSIYFFLSVFAFLFLYNSIGRAENGVILDELLTEVQKTLIRVRDAIPVSSINDTLATAIIEAAKSAKKASKRKPPLHLSKLTLKIRFIVKREISGGVNFKLLPVTIKLGGQAGDVTTQEIIVEFKS